MQADQPCARALVKQHGLDRHPVLFVFRRCRARRGRNGVVVQQLLIRAMQQQRKVLPNRLRQIACRERCAADTQRSDKADRHSTLKREAPHALRLLGQAFERPADALVELVGHFREIVMVHHAKHAPSKSLRSCSRAARRRVLTVPSGTPSMDAISRVLKPSR